MPTLLIFVPTAAACLLVLFAVMRGALTIRGWSPGVASMRELAGAFAVGVRFDLATTGYLLIGLLVVAWIPGIGLVWGRSSARRFTIIASTVVSVALLLMLAELEFFNEFRVRFNQLALEYLNQPATVGGMVWHNYPVVRYGLLWCVLAAVVYAGFHWMVRRATKDDAAPPRLALLREAIVTPVLLAGLVFAGRGGFGPAPLRWGDAFHSDNEFVNQVSLNGLWTLGQSAKDFFGRQSVSKGWTKSMPLDEARRITRRMLVAEGETLLDSGNRTVLRRGGSRDVHPLQTPDGKPPNVVLVVMESFSARFCGATGGPRGFTPRFDALADDGLLFTRCFSAGSHTHQGIFASTLGFPAIPGFDALMQSGAANQEFCSLAELLKSRGYQTLFLYNGNLEWDNMRGFFRKQGVQRFVSGEDITNPRYRDAVWGVSDGDLFDRANEEFESAARNGPFFATILTLSNHQPFQVPPVPGAAPITDMGELNARLTAMRYADYAVGQFIQDARKRDYFKDTLFIFVGDHGFHVDPVLTEVHLLYHHVPLLFYAPGMLPRRGVDSRVASQVNIVPSTLDLLGRGDLAHASWGRSLFDDTFTDGGLAVFKLAGGGSATAIARGDELLVMSSAAAPPRLTKYELGERPHLLPVPPGPEHDRRQIELATELRAFVQASLADLTSGRAGGFPAPITRLDP